MTADHLPSDGARHRRLGNEHFKTEKHFDGIQSKGSEHNVTNKVPHPRGGAVVSHDALVVDQLGIFSMISVFKDWIEGSTARSWIVLVACIVAEIAATSLMKIASDKGSMTRTIQSIALYVASLLGFGVCLKKIDVSVAYAVWSAMGTGFVSVFGIVFWGEDYGTKKLVSLFLIVVGVVGLNLSDDSEH